MPSFAQADSKRRNFTHAAILLHLSLPTGAVNVAVGGYHTCAILTSGAINCWGYNGFGQLGIGYTTDMPSPTAVTGLKAALCTLCTASTSCSEGHYLSGCVGTSAGLCTACQTICPVGEHLTGCNGTSAGSCVSCPAGSYRLSGAAWAGWVICIKVWGHYQVKV